LGGVGLALLCTLITRQRHREVSNGQCHIKGRVLFQPVAGFWNAGPLCALTGLNEAGRKAQEKIMKISSRLQKVAEYLDQKTTKKSFSFEFLYGRIVTAGG